MTPMFPAPGKTPREDTAAVMKFYKLPKCFPPSVMAEARRIPSVVDAEAELRRGGRRDLRREFVFTCDPQSARDYDDALSLSKDRRGNLVLGVHIADVSHYVKPGSAIDREAYRRSTSVYLCDRVVPMLPESLSNGVCSLVPGEDRLAFSVFLTFDKSGEVVKREFAKSVIRSKARYTYEQVMNIISGGDGKCGGARVGKRELRTIREISALAQRLRAKRFASGALDIEIPEAEVILDDAGEMTGLVTRPYDESHQMVEECMVAANEAVAKELWTKGVKILARLHEPPDEEKIDMLRAELRGLGVKVGNISNPKVFAQFLQSIKRNPLYPTLAASSRTTSRAGARRGPRSCSRRGRSTPPSARRSPRRRRGVFSRSRSTGFSRTSCTRARCWTTTPSCPSARRTDALSRFPSSRSRDWCT